MQDTETAMDFADPPTVFIPRTEWDRTQTVRGRRERLAALPGVVEVRRAYGPRLALVAPGLSRPLLAYVCALNGWRVLSDDGNSIELDCDRTGAQVVDIDQVHGTGFSEGGYYGGPGAWGGYGVRDAAGPWYRFTTAKGLQPCAAEAAIAALNRSAERHCAGDREFIAGIVSF
jgi:hypothetical protein